jgi:hypothetical protein
MIFSDMVTLLLPSDDRWGSAKHEPANQAWKRETLSGRARRERVSRCDELTIFPIQPQKPPIALIRRAPVRSRPWPLRGCC